MNPKAILPVLLTMAPVATCHALDPPAMQEGLWSVTATTIENPGNKRAEHTTTVCRSHAYDAYALSVARREPGCQPSIESFDDGQYKVEAHCVQGGTTIDSKATSTFQGVTQVHSVTVASYSPPLAGVAAVTMDTVQKFQGPCPSGMQPGDMTRADGSIRHLWKH
jgi:hypothetical protein